MGGNGPLTYSDAEKLAHAIDNNFTTYSFDADAEESANVVDGLYGIAKAVNRLAVAVEEVASYIYRMANNESR